MKAMNGKGSDNWLRKCGVKWELQDNVHQRLVIPTTSCVWNIAIMIFFIDLLFKVFIYIVLYCIYSIIVASYCTILQRCNVSLLNTLFLCSLCTLIHFLDEFTFQVEHFPTRIGKQSTQTDRNVGKANQD